MIYSLRNKKWMNRLSQWALICLFGAACHGDAGRGEEGQPSEVGHESVRSLKARAKPIEDPEILASFISGQRALYADLMAALPEELDGQNAMISALSVQQALGMTWAGALGETARQMAQALRFGDSAHAMQNTLSQALLSRAMPESSNTYGEHFGALQLSMANAVWSRKGLTWKRPFLDALAENYGAGVEMLDFAGAPEASRRFINAWVEEATQERIKDLLPEHSITEFTALILSNAVYFKAPWQKPFEVALTERAAFTKGDGKAIEADFVREQAWMAYAEGDGWQAVAKPFRGSLLCMDFILPSAGSFATFESSLNGEKLDRIFGALASGSAEVALALPKFEFDTSVALKAAFKSLGMTLPFEEAADFTGMTEDTKPFFIGDIFHKTFISLDESGVEAAAATAVMMCDTAAPSPDEVKVFRADRPFFFAIRDTETNAILFFGRVSDPTAR